MSGEQRDVLYGMFPSTVTNARVAVRGAPPVEIAAHAVRGLPNAYFVMLLPRGTVIDRVDALDDRGRSQLTVPGPSVPDHLLSPGPGPQAYIAGSPLVHGAANGHAWQLRAESLGDVVCTQIDVDGRREPEHCWPAIDLMQFTDDAEFIVGIAGPDVARVVVQPLDSPPASTTLVRDRGIPLTLFVAPRPTGARGYDVTAFDKAGRVVGGGSVRSSSSSSGGSSSGSSSPG
jgi:hypothetical protein